MPNARARQNWNPWVALAGVAVLIALAVGLLGGGASAAPVTTFGLYEDDEPTITKMTLSPTQPRAKKGFKATLTTANGSLTYRIYAEDNIGNRWFLARGTANGEKTTATIGKKLKQGQYDVYAGTLFTGGRDRFGRELFSDNVSQPLVVRRKAG